MGRPAETTRAAESSPLDNEKRVLELAKLKGEIRRLESENSNWGQIASISWPLVSGILTIAVSCVALTVSWQTQSFSAREERKKTFFSALQMATDGKAGEDARIAGIWTLSDYWSDPECSETIANALAAVLATDATDESPAARTKIQAVRLAAANVIGNAINEENADTIGGVKLRTLLYGDARHGSLGAITRYQQELSGLRDDLISSGADTFSIDQKLEATREAIRQNWENLEFGMFYEHDLDGIKLYQARLHGAYFVRASMTGANLCGADVSGATFTSADLSFADLAGADLAGSSGWSKVKMTKTNVHNVKNAPAEFVEAARQQGALDLTWLQWQTYLRDRGINVQTDIYTSCDH